MRPPVEPATYFGRSTFAGAVNFTTRMPGNEFRASADASYARFDTVEASGSLEGPIVRNVVSARVSGRYYSTDGAFANFGYPGRLGAQETKSAALTLAFTPAAAVRLRGYVTAWEDDDGPPAAGILDARDYGCRTPTAGAANNYVYGPVGAVPRERMTQQVDVPQDVIRRLAGTADILDQDFLTHFGLRRKAIESHLIADVDLGGGYTLGSNLAYHHSEFAFISDTGFRDLRDRPNPSFPAVAGSVPYFSRTVLGQTDFESKSGELRIASPTQDRLSWLLGVNHFRQESLRNTIAFANTGLSYSVRDTVDGNRTTGIFGAINFSVTDTLKLSAEGRYQWDRVIQKSRSRTSTFPRRSSRSPRESS